jgi:hypothetical protein
MDDFFKYSELVGFVGTVWTEVHFQTLEPIVYRKSDGVSHMLTEDKPAFFSPSKEDLEAKAKDETITLISKPVPAFEDAVTLLISDEFRARAHAENTVKESLWRLPKEGLWFQIKTPSPEPCVYWGSFMKSGDAERQGNKWAQALYDRALDDLRRRIRGAGSDMGKEYSTIQMGIGATSDRNIERKLELAMGLHLTLTGEETMLGNHRHTLKDRFPEFGNEAAFSREIGELWRSLKSEMPSSQTALKAQLKK